ncbi:MAG: helix-turn-helix domain-containing protein, partial [Dehalococcoidia bacterium]
SVVCLSRTARASLWGLWELRGANIALDQSNEVESTVQRILSQLPDARMLTVEEVASELRVSKETVRRWVRSGQLPCIKLPRGIRIPSEVIKELNLKEVIRYSRLHIEMERNHLESYLRR